MMTKRIPSRLNRKLPESLYPILGLELLRRRMSFALVDMTAKDFLEE